jgi:hypothetical protein
MARCLFSCPRPACYLEDTGPVSLRGMHHHYSFSEHANTIKRMIENLAIGFLIVWLGGVLFLVFRAMNLYRLILNNLAPGRTYAEVARVPNLFFNRRFYLSAPEIDPEYLTEFGRQCQRAAVANGLGLAAWALGGVVLIVCYTSYRLSI